jgi:hypothetical protein
MLVEVFSNLVHVTPKHWDVFARPGVRLTTSYNSDDAEEHAAIVGRPGAHRLALVWVTVEPPRDASTSAALPRT